MTQPPTARSTQLGILAMLGAAVTFGLQDGLSRLLAEAYNVLSVVTIRYWFFVLFVLAFSASRPGGIRVMARTRRPILQIFRSILLITQICTAAYGFTVIGLVSWQVIFASYPLMIAALSVPFLGERVGWRRWLAIIGGFVGVVVALDPGGEIFGVPMLLPLFGAAQFALYGILTRIAGRVDSAGTSFFWTAIVGAVAITLIVPAAWNPPVGNDWWWMLLLCLAGVGGHFLLIKAFEIAEAGVLQPFAYFGIATSAAVGYFGFGDAVTPAMLTGGGIIIAAGLFTLWRERVVARRTADKG
jgi:drug/metabolite transporter (DMT)-like permease